MSDAEEGPRSESTTSDVERVYAKDADDDEFIQCLISVVEQHIVLQRLESEQTNARAKVLELRLDDDDHFEAVEKLEQCHEPALTSLIEHRTTQNIFTGRELAEANQKLDRIDSSLHRTKRRRKQLLEQLYRDADRFIYRDVNGDVECDSQDCSMGFHRGLSYLKSMADLMARYESSSADVQRRLIQTNREVEEVAADPTATTVDELAAKEGRRRALVEFRQCQREQDQRRANQMAREAEFFLGEALSALVSAEILPSQTTPQPSPSTNSVPRLSPRPPAKSPSPQNLVPPPILHPATQLLQAARTQAALAHERLDLLRRNYVVELGKTLLLHPSFTRADFDANYIQEHGSRCFTFCEVEALEAVLQADAAVGYTWREALEAGATDLPPSPVECAGREDDGFVASMGKGAGDAKARAPVKVAPRVQKWGRDVARGGTPESPSRLPSSGKRKFEGLRGDEEEEFEGLDSGGEDETRPKGAVERVKGMREEYGRRMEGQEAKRQKVGEASRRRRRRCAVQ